MIAKKNYLDEGFWSPRLGQGKSHFQQQRLYVWLRHAQHWLID
jgi:hypothetical protein